MPRTIPYKFSPQGVTDTRDVGAQQQPGSMIALTNLIPSVDTANQWVGRPGALQLPNSATSMLYGPITAMIISADFIVGMANSFLYPGYDVPFVYNLATNAYVAITGVTASNVPLSVASNDPSWFIPNICTVGVKQIICHPGYSIAVGFFFGYIDFSNELIPVYNSANTTTNTLPYQPTLCVNFNERAMFFMNPPAGANAPPAIIGSNVLEPLIVGNSSYTLTFGDYIPLTAGAGLPLSNQLGGITQSLIVFKGTTNIYQITGDFASSIYINSLNVATGTNSPLGVASTPNGLAFVSTDGIRLINFQGLVSPPIGYNGEGVVAPFLNSGNPAEISMACNGTMLRICGPNSAGQQQDWIYNIVTQQWGGPHTNAASFLGVYGYEFIAAFASPWQQGLWQESVVPTAASTYSDGVSAAAVGTLSFTNGTMPGDQLALNGSIFPFISGASSGYNIQASSTPATAVANVILALSASTDAQALLCSYTAGNVIAITYKTTGTSGNNFDLSTNSPNNILFSGPTLTGGATGKYASGTITFPNGTVPGETMTLGAAANGSVWTFISGASSGYNIQASTNPTLATIYAQIALAASTNSPVDLATYSYASTVVTVTYTTTGAVGNSFTLNSNTTQTAYLSSYTLSGGSTAAAATGSFLFPTGTTAGNTLSINGSVWTFISGASSGYNIQASATGTTAAANVTAALSASSDVNALLCTYATSTSTTNITCKTTGTAGNNINIAWTLNNISGPTLTGGAATVNASATVTFPSGTQPSQILNLNGSVFTFALASSGYNIQASSTPATAATNAAAALSASSDTNALLCTYAAVGDVLTITYATSGTGGNSFTLATLPSGSSYVSMPTLTGGSPFIAPSGTFYFPSGTVAGMMLNLNGSVFSFGPSSSGYVIQANPTPGTAATNVQVALAASSDPNASLCAYAVTGTSNVTVTYKTTGTAGNTFGLSIGQLFSVGVTGATLQGGSSASPESFVFQTSYLPLRDDIRQCASVLSVQYGADGGGSWAVTATDQAGTVIDSVTLAPPAVLAANQIPWNVPLVFDKMSIAVTGQLSAGTRIGDLYLEYQPLGYVPIPFPG